MPLIGGDIVKKSGKEWGLPVNFSNECWICGYPIYSGKQKAHGFQELKSGEKWEICSTCLQIQIFNKESLHKENAPNSVGPVKRLYVCDSDMERVSAYDVIDTEPYLVEVKER